MHALLHSVPSTLQQASTNPHLCWRLLDPHGQVWYVHKLQYVELHTKVFLTESLQQELGRCRMRILCTYLCHVIWKEICHCFPGLLTAGAVECGRNLAEWPHLKQILQLRAHLRSLDLILEPAGDF